MSQVTSVAKGWKLRSDLQRETGFCLSWDFMFSWSELSRWLYRDISPRSLVEVYVSEVPIACHLPDYMA
jgi:hypothetical protein